jgi:arabinan endo-1,5-alpha-L-arabinosidase
MTRRLVLHSMIVVIVVMVLARPIGNTVNAENPTETPRSTESAPPVLQLRGVIAPIHDPTLIKAGEMYYIFSTGQGIPIHCSKDMLTWDICDRVFSFYPPWVIKAVPNVTDLWAPDIVFWEGKYHLYYAVSTFGSNQSAIGLATNVTLDQSSKDYKWVDQGEVIASQTSDDFNAIDPNLVTDQNGQRWLALGSFWTGIKLRAIDSATGKLASSDPTLYALASRPGNTAIEGAFITYRSGYYYLFVSFDFCCRGVASTYNIRVGRAEHITGPYADREGKPMLDGGGSLIFAGSDRWHGPGHNSIYIENGIYWIVYHAYDAQTNGAPTLRMDALQWDNDGWPMQLTSAE